MQLQVSGRNLDVSAAIREYAERKLARIERHLTEDTRVDLELAIERNRSISASQHAELTVWTRGPVLRAHEYAEDMYAAIDLAVDKLDRQVRRYRERRRHWRPHHQVRDIEALLPLSDDDEAASLALANGSEPDAPIPSIVKTKRFNMKPMHPDEAALQLELVGHEFYVFLNAESDAVAVIYRRRDGNLGVIEPVAG
ncbi:MAG: putative sigma-54 modulation protein [Gaiellales bacterium]|jgi:putative sigma-54 modulation protein|nr:putative sigma-54 modulation protein [Gaiellales bacterium]MEA2478079.1 putative sigma-54 modulation protein [Thermoleophilaceae bacterium]